ncbi:hypothetical protein [Streptomyces pseudovenezuelae]|uniref:hypothetical protein n=1 Tax=Streptomyces pseudovenezuelae TaxID=67350 RepID=UPI0024770A68|nr:hypothetical protein [Streptomyces pseudovenezuelae]
MDGNGTLEGEGLAAGGRSEIISEPTHSDRHARLQLHLLDDEADRNRAELLSRALPLAKSTSACTSKVNLCAHVLAVLRARLVLDHPVNTDGL